MYDFYYPDGTKCKNVDEFVEFYSKAYYLYNSYYAESIAIDILKKQKGSISENLSLEDIFFILAWKIGGINQLKSSQSIVYKDGWDEKGYSAQSYGHNIDVCIIKEKLDRIDLDEGLSAFLDGLKDIPGIGNTYKVTLAYFATGGLYLIYDQFVDRARDAIKKGYIPQKGDVTDKHSIMDISTGKCVEIHSAYTDDLKKIFEDRYKDRAVDQALWVYGHMFR